MAIYSLTTYYPYEGSDGFLLEGPEVDDWNKYCQSFIDQAALKAIETSKENKVNDELEIEDRVHVYDIILELIDILENKGYKVVQADEYAIKNMSPYYNMHGELVNDDLPLTRSTIELIARHNEKTNEYHAKKHGFKYW